MVPNDSEQQQEDQIWRSRDKNWGQAQQPTQDRLKFPAKSLET